MFSCTTLLRNTSDGAMMTPYSTTQLITQIDAGYAPEYLHFWGHRKGKAAHADKSCLSQWYPAHFILNGVTYRTAEQYMMASKARLFNDEVALEKILICTTPAIAKKLGREVKGYVDSVWLAQRSQIVVAGNLAKFSHDAVLAAFLLSTKDCVIVEASPVDKIWGIGMAADHADSRSPARWKGLNLLGFALMEVRDKLRCTKFTRL
jgi:ribA/ribD-fused uncharacterized protein